MNNNIFQDDADIIKKYGEALVPKGKNRLEINLQYFAGMMSKLYNVIFFTDVGWFEWTDGQWVKVRKCELQKRISTLLQGAIQAYPQPEDSSRPAFDLVNTSNIREILDTMEYQNNRGDTLPPLDSDVIPVKNGLLRWNPQTQDFNFKQYTPDDMISHTLDVDYVREAKSDLFDKVLSEILPDQDDRRVVQEYMGAALFPENRTRKFILFQGEGGCGKSLLVKFLTTIMTQDRTFDLDFRALRANYAFSALTTQTLLTASEAISEAFCQSAGVEFVKKAVGGDFFATSQKYRNEKINHYGFYSFIIVSNNEMHFKYDGRGDEFKDRLIPILFNEHIENPDKTLADKLLMEHRPAILNWLIDGARRVRKNNWNIQLTNDQISRRDRIVEATYGVKNFVKNHIVESTGKFFLTREAYELFTRLHKTAGYESLSEDTFRKRLAQTMATEYGAASSNTIPTQNGKTGRGYRGFKLVDPASRNSKKTVDVTHQASVSGNKEGGETNEK